MNEISARNAIILGGGIAGPLAAIALERAGFSAAVYEAHPPPSGIESSSGQAIGAWLTVAVNGLAAMRALGVAAEVEACGFPSETIEFLAGSGKRLGALPLGGRLADGTSTHTMKRADLHRVLEAALAARGIPITYAKRVVGVDERGDRVVARFEDGSEAEGDLLIGADGVHSRVRHAIDPRAPSPRYNGLGNVGGFAPSSASPSPSSSPSPSPSSIMGEHYRMVFGKRAFFGYTPAPSGEVWWFANPPSARELPRAELSAIDWRARLIELFADDRGPMVELIRATPGKLVYSNQYDLGRVPTWQRGRVVLIGDAAHAASPSSGQGASMAAEDAVVLASCLRSHAELVEGLQAFVAARRARVERVVEYGRKYTSSKAAGPIGRVVRDLMLPLAFRSMRPDSREWLFDHRVA
ncbi:FAD-dependent monooxygenase [Nannocystaceae bacterium ST9]